MILYKLENITKTYNFEKDKVYALENLNLEINKGEVVVILGPSGSGKSTMLNILSGIDNPTKGKIYYNEKRIDKMNEEQLRNYRKNDLGFVFQSYNLIPNLTVKENVELGKELTNHPLDLNELIELVGLKNHINNYPYQLSGGQMQRIAIARALVKNPKVLFCDEPTGALDEKTGKIVLKLLQDINKKYHTTIVIVTHNPSIALMANQIIKMNSGKLVNIEINKKIASALDLRWA